MRRRGRTSSRTFRDPWTFFDDDVVLMSGCVEDHTKFQLMFLLNEVSSILVLKGTVRKVQRNMSKLRQHQN